MKIHELVSSTFITEGHVSPSVMISLSNIMQRGKATNHFEFIVLCRLLQMLKDGSFYQENNFLNCNLTTNKGLLDALRAMPPAQILKIATFLWKFVNVKDNAGDPTTGYMSYCKPEQDILPWLQMLAANDASD